MAESPTSRSTGHCRKQEWPYYITEKYNAATRKRVDAFGFGDILVIDGQPGSLLVQATSTPHAANRKTKILTECTEDAQAWLEVGNRIEVWGWAKRGAAGKRKLWTLKIYEVTLGDFEEQPEGEDDENDS